MTARRVFGAVVVALIMLSGGLAVTESPVMAIAVFVAAMGVAGLGFDHSNTAAYVALLGIALAGLGTYLTTKELDERQATRDENARVAGVTGTARLMQEEFYVRVEDLRSTWHRGRFPVRPDSLASDLSNSERGSVTAELQPAEWQKLAAGDVRVARADRLLRRRKDKKVGAQQGDKPDLCDAMQRFQAAALALTRVAGRFPQGLKPIPGDCRRCIVPGARRVTPPLRALR
jgi:hypothetical protein